MSNSIINRFKPSEVSTDGGTTFTSTNSGSGSGQPPLLFGCTSTSTSSARYLEIGTTASGSDTSPNYLPVAVASTLTGIKYSASQIGTGTSVTFELQVKAVNDAVTTHPLFTVSASEDYTTITGLSIPLLEDDRISVKVTPNSLSNSPDDMALNLIFG